METEHLPNRQHLLLETVPLLSILVAEHCAVPV